MFCETMTVGDLADQSSVEDGIGIEGHSCADRIVEFLGSGWHKQNANRQIVVVYPEHNRLRRIDSEVSYQWHT